MDFYDIADGYFRSLDYESPYVSKYPEFKEFFKDLIFGNKRCLVYGDYDPDGLFSVLIIKEAFHILGFDNFDIVPYTHRTHALDSKAVEIAIVGGYDYMIICDTGSSNFDEIREIADSGVKVIVIDHHETPYVEGDFSDNVVYINSTVENRERSEVDEKLIVSAAALVYILIDKFFEDCRVDSSPISAYALSSMYSDSVDMSSRFARGLYTRATTLDSALLPVEIDGYLNRYKRFTRRFIEFDMVPKLNAAFRSEDFSAINEVYLKHNRPEIGECMKIANLLADMHRDIVEIVKYTSEIVYTEELNNFVIGNLDSVNAELDVEEHKLYNFTGLVANKLAERYKKAAIVLCTSADGVKGSFRDHLGRNYLGRFQTICKAGGHGPAFGFWISMFDIADFIERVKLIDQDFSIQKVPNEPILLPSANPPDDVCLADIAKYNEFAGQVKDVVLLQLMRRADMPEKIDKYGQYQYRWSDKYIVSQKRIPVGNEILVKPTLTKSIKLYAV